jgi:hypothetical protein
MAGEFDNLNDIIHAVNDCADILVLNISSMSSVTQKMDEMQSLLGRVSQLRRESLQIINMRLEDAFKVIQAMRSINDGDDGNLQAVESMLQLVVQGGNEMKSHFLKFAEAIELIRGFISKLDERTTEMTGNQAAALEILRGWTLM